MKLNIHNSKYNNILDAPICGIIAGAFRIDYIEEFSNMVRIYKK